MIDVKKHDLQNSYYTLREVCELVKDEYYSVKSWFVYNKIKSIGKKKVTSELFGTQKAKKWINLYAKEDVFKYLNHINYKMQKRKREDSC